VKLSNDDLTSLNTMLCSSYMAELFAAQVTWRSSAYLGSWSPVGSWRRNSISTSSPKTSV